MLKQFYVWGTPCNGVLYATSTDAVIEYTKRHLPDGHYAVYQGQRFVRVEQLTKVGEGVYKKTIEDWEWAEMRRKMIEQNERRSD